MKRRFSKRLLLLGAAVLVPCVLPWTSRPLQADDSAVPPPTAPRAVQHLELLGSDSLSSGYGLGVVELPPPPAFQAEAVAERHDCPVEVRGLVEGEALADSFVVLASGDDSWLLRVGDGVRTSAGWLAVTALDAELVTLRLGETSHRCRIGSFE